MALVRAWPYWLLSTHRAGLRERFVEKYPNAWLLWEPVLWKPSTKGVAAETLPTNFGAQPEVPPEGEPHCFELREGERILLGRLPGNDLRINDASVSREHLCLEPLGGLRWRAVPANDHSVTLVRGQPLQPSGADLQPGDQIRVGGVILTFEDSASLGLRLDARPHPG